MIIAAGVAGGLMAGGGVASSILGGNAASQGAQTAASQQQMGIGQGLNFATDMFNRSQSYLNPFYQAGVGATGTLSNLFVNPQEKLNQLDLQRVQLEQALEQAKGAVPSSRGPWETIGWDFIRRAGPGSNQSERAAQLFYQEEDAANVNVKQAQTALDTFNKQYDMQKKQMSQQASGADLLASSPAYEFASKQVQRMLAAQGMTNSAAAIQQQGGLAASLFGQQVSGLQNLAGTGANAAGALAGSAMNLGQQGMQAFSGMGQAAAQGTMGQTNAQVGTINGVTGAVNQGLNTFINANMLQQMLGGQRLLGGQRQAGSPSPSVGSMSSLGNAPAFNQSLQSNYTPTAFNLT